MGENYKNCGASADGICPECGYESQDEGVKCNMCGFKGGESDLIIIRETYESFHACPNCKTDAYLSDVRS